MVTGQEQEQFRIYSADLLYLFLFFVKMSQFSTKMVSNPLFLSNCLCHASVSVTMFQFQILYGMLFLLFVPLSGIWLLCTDDIVKLTISCEYMAIKLMILVRFGNKLYRHDTSSLQYNRNEIDG